MIIREDAAHLLLITQPDHARLAGTIMAAWQADALPASPRRDVVLFATTHHDDGWIDVDRVPLVNESDGRLLDFITAPDEVRLTLWPRAVERLSGTPYAAALVAQHALEIYEPSRARLESQGFFSRMEDLRDRHLASARPLGLSDLLEDYFFVGMGDTLSLTFCNGWTEPVRRGRYETSFQGSRLTVDPDPFGGREIPLSVPAKRIANRRFRMHEASTAYETAPVVSLTAIASGPSDLSSPSRPPTR